MSRVQLAINVADLDEAVAFYATLFATGPGKVRPGYANFTITDPPLTLVLMEAPDRAPGSLNHLGVEVATSAEVATARTRLAAEGLVTAVEEATACCFAVQDKVWVDAPGGEAWEIYTVLSDVEHPPGQLGPAEACDDTCCPPAPAALDRPAHGGSGCC